MSRHDTHLWEDILLHISMNEALFWPLHPLVHYLYTNVTRNPAKKYCFASVHQCCIVFEELHNVSGFSLQVLNSQETRQSVWKYDKFLMPWMPDYIKCDIKCNKFSGKNAGFIRNPQALDFLTTHICCSNRIVHFGSICVYVMIVRQFITNCHEVTLENFWAGVRFCMLIKRQIKNRFRVIPGNFFYTTVAAYILQWTVLMLTSKHKIYHT